MTLALYIDHHVPRVVTNELRMRGLDVLTAYEDGANRLNDSELLDRAYQLKRVLVTQDDDLLAEAVKRQRQGEDFCGVIYAHQLRVSIGTFIHNLEIIAEVGELEDMINRVEYLPL